MPKVKKFKIEAEIVHGECPTCSELTMLVGLSNDVYRCMNCGADLYQHVNGKISYLPIMASRKDGGKVFVKEWKQVAKQSFKYFTPRDKPKKRGPRQHKKSLNKAEKRQKKMTRYKGQG